MSKRNHEIALRHLLSHAEEAVNICQGKERSDLDSDRLLNLALTVWLKSWEKLPTASPMLFNKSIPIYHGFKWSALETA